jgi:hypothetical protein
VQKAETYSRVLKVFTRSDAVGGVVLQKWKSMLPEFLECPRGPSIMIKKEYLLYEQDVMNVTAFCTDGYRW